MSSAQNKKNPQTKEDRVYILANLPEGVHRVQVLEPAKTEDDEPKQSYKRPDDVDVERDEILLNGDGAPIVMRGKPGRKRKNELASLSPQIGEVEQARTEHISLDPLRRAARKDADGDGVFHALLSAMAEEAASIEFEKHEAARHGQDTSTHSTKRSRVLKNIADTWLKRKHQIEGGIIDLDSPAFQVLFGYILETFKEAMLDTGTRSEHIETIFVKLVSELGNDSWREEAKARMKDRTR
jgi:hypothetical protein